MDFNWAPMMTRGASFYGSVLQMTVVEVSGAYVQTKITLQRSEVQLPERLACLGIMCTQLRTPLKPLGTSQYYRVEGLKAGSPSIRLPLSW